ncbi:response regulator transcription factor [Arenicella xantha]|uniref:Two-component system torCAD operon response regulator TorR n=1 Tax=Arenicella xantha TaxID=644221 RepID=A0A395JLT9_9GAMM|nr:response regulator transcription factor [Arenicella xantha]RBP48750.1 two-component system torCAD operon response regulator TorR [Arenicella xantha]
MSKLNVIVVDDDVVTRYLIGSALKDAGISTQECDSAESLFELLETQRVEVIILDMVLPNVNGLSALTYVRERSDVGIIMISSRANANQRLDGLKKGADDFINKPVDTDELIWKVRRLAERVQSQRGNNEELDLKIGNCLLVVSENQLTRSDQTADCRLTDAELRLLITLLHHDAQPCSRKLLHQCISRTEVTISNDRSIDTLISRIRRKLESLNCSASIAAVRGKGYRLTID